MNIHTAIFGGGCFWCTEAVYARLDGVHTVAPGYAGGTVANPTYEAVCAGTTGHAEVIQVTFDPEVISYPQLLQWFWKSHDATTPNRQGADVGTQYRSIILFENEGQKADAEQSMQTAQAASRQPIVTELVALDHFYPAEDYHHGYYAKHGRAPYCKMVIAPKLHKLNLA